MLRVIQQPQGNGFDLAVFPGIMEQDGCSKQGLVSDASRLQQLFQY